MRGLQKGLKFKLLNLFFYIILLNLAFFVVEVILAPGLVRSSLGMNRGAITNLEFYRLLTYGFTHADFQHLLFNMIGLFFFGYYVEEKLGSYEFLLFYIISGLFCGLLSYVFYFLVLDKSVLVIGASGSVYAVMTAFLILYADKRINFFGLIRSNVAVIVGLYMTIGLVRDALGSIGGYSNISFIGHFTGVLFAFLYSAYRLKLNPIETIKNAIKARY